MNYNKADFIASYGISSQLPESDRPELSFSGRSNVGKACREVRGLHHAGGLASAGGTECPVPSPPLTAQQALPSFRPS